jgi:hypothetical protein
MTRASPEEGTLTNTAEPPLPAVCTEALFLNRRAEAERAVFF